MKLIGLSRQIALSMALTVVVVILIFLVSSYLLYAALLELYPNWTPEDPWTPTPIEWIWMAAVTLVGLIAAGFASLRLSQRILTPLNSVAEAIRKVARGDLRARAIAGDRSLGETATLVDDFNAMAARLQHLEQDFNFWSAAIAHELRTPVTILRGRLQGLAEGVFPSDEAQFRSLLTQVEGLGRLIEDLRALSLAQGGRLDLHIEEIDLTSEVKAATELVMHTFRDAGFDLDVSTKLNVLRARCDAVRIRQALLALLENARRYATPGAVRIELRSDGCWAHIAIEDSGPGIDPELAAHIFDPFVRGDHSRSRRGGGSGLGLAVVRAIAEAHGGRVICLPGKTGGARFELTLPREPTHLLAI
jgi:two-component system sensor histidine kinase AdeS